MSALARLDGTIMDLSAPAPSDMARIAEVHNTIKRGDSVLERTEPGGGEMFLRKHGDRYYALHSSGAQCTEDHTMTPETDEPQAPEGLLVPGRCQRQESPTRQQRRRRRRRRNDYLNLIRRQDERRLSSTARTV